MFLQQVNGGYGNEITSKINKDTFIPLPSLDKGEILCFRLHVERVKSQAVCVGQVTKILSRHPLAVLFQPKQCSRTLFICLKNVTNLDL